MCKKNKNRRRRLTGRADMSVSQMFFPTCVCKTPTRVPKKWGSECHIQGNVFQLCVSNVMIIIYWSWYAFVRKERHSFSPFFIRVSFFYRVLKRERNTRQTVTDNLNNYTPLIWSCCLYVLYEYYYRNVFSMYIWFYSCLIMYFMYFYCMTMYSHCVFMYDYPDWGFSVLFTQL
jgi:hypothetical protein